LEYTCKIGGAQGEGIDSAGETFALTLHRLGYYCFAYRHSPSLSDGGHANYKVRISETPIGHHGDGLDMLVALDGLTVAEDLHELSQGAVLLCDAALSVDVGNRTDLLLCPVPFARIAEELGSANLNSWVALGAAAALLGLGERSLGALIEERFAAEGSKVVSETLAAVDRGYAFVAAQGYKPERGLPQLPEIPRPGRLFITGNEALALGAVAGGCRFMAAYPTTSAMDVMDQIIKHLQEAGCAVLQAPDELAAINMAIGAACAGVRAMTITSGPGFMQALDLAGIAEIPLVIINAQRGGPSTGHGDTVRIVLAPSTAEECIRFGAEAFNLAERYQCPVIVTSDMYLGESRMSVDALAPEHIGKVEDPPMRLAQAPKRQQKLESFDPATLGVAYEGPSDPDLLLVGWGSTRGVLDESRHELAAHGTRVAHLHLGVMAPFPMRVAQWVQAARKILVVEQAITGQLAGLIEQQVGGHGKIHSFLKYDGNPLLRADVLSACEAVLAGGIDHMPAESR